jgi:hypothetical protein
MQEELRVVEEDLLLVVLVAVGSPVRAHWDSTGEVLAQASLVEGQEAPTRFTRA